MKQYSKSMFRRCFLRLATPIQCTRVSTMSIIGSSRRSKYTCFVPRFNAFSSQPLSLSHKDKEERKDKKNWFFFTIYCLFHAFLLERIVVKIFIQDKLKELIDKINNNNTMSNEEEYTQLWLEIEKYLQYNGYLVDFSDFLIKDLKLLEVIYQSLNNTSSYLPILKVLNIMMNSPQICNYLINNNHPLLSKLTNLMKHPESVEYAQLLSLNISMYTKLSRHPAHHLDEDTIHFFISILAYFQDSINHDDDEIDNNDHKLWIYQTQHNIIRIFNQYLSKII